MRRYWIILLISILALSGCNSGQVKEEVLVAELKDEITQLTSYQEDILDEITQLRDQVSKMEIELDKKDDQLETLQMEIDQVKQISSVDYSNLFNQMEEIRRLYSDVKLIEEVFLVEDYSVEKSQITVKDMYDTVSIFKVSESCKVLVAGQYRTVYQTLEEGMDFIEAMVEDDIHKVRLIIKDDLVEQIIMHGSSW